MIATLKKQILLSVVLKARLLLNRHTNSSTADPISAGLGNISLISSSCRFNDESNSNVRCPPRPKESSIKLSMAPSSVTAIQQHKSSVMQANGNGSLAHLEREYHEAIRELNSLQSNNRVLSLAKYNNPQEILPHVRKQLQLAGIDVQDLNRLNAIHVTGTKGKGSTCIFLESILLSNPMKINSMGGRRLRVGCYTSPHLIHVTERIRLDGRPIDRLLFVDNFWHIFNKLKSGTEREQLVMPNYFTFLTILAFYTFLKEKVDCAIVEVGMGGEFDPTNVLVRPVACAITTLDLDHTNILGRTLKSIAWTKAGIIKPGVPMFTIDHNQAEATEMIKSRAEQSNSPVYFCRPLKISKQQQLGIKGAAQSTNASVACELASCLLKHLKIDTQANESQPVDLPIGFTSTGLEYEALPETFQQGLMRARFPGRCHVVDCDKVSFFLDGAHTKKSVENCLDWFLEASTESSSPDYQFRYLIINIIGERDRREVLRPLLMHKKLFRKMIFTSNRLDTIQVQDGTFSDTYSPPQLPSHERSLENVKNNAKVWCDLIRENYPSAKCEVEIHATIPDSIQVILNDYSNALGTETSKDHSIGKPHVLATGSLHFVGAVLEAIERLKDCQR